MLSCSELIRAVDDDDDDEADGGLQKKNKMGEGESEAENVLEWTELCGGVVIALAECAIGNEE